MKMEFDEIGAGGEKAKAREPHTVYKNHNFILKNITTPITRFIRFNSVNRSSLETW